jgi:biotin operon repressor
MPELPAYPPDAAICRLLAEEPLPTAVIADRLGMPDRTVRYRLAQLRRAGVVFTGDDGLHYLAAPAGPDLAAPAGPDLAAPAGPDLAAPAGPDLATRAADDHPVSDMPSGKVGGRGTVIALLAVVGIGLAAVALAHKIRPGPPPEPPPPNGYAAGWYPGPAW